MNKGYVYVLICYALIGVSYPIAKNVMDQIPTWFFTCATMGIGALLLLPFSLKFDRGVLANLSFRDWVTICIQSLLGSVLYTIFLLYGMTSSTAVMASIFTSITPVFVVILSAVFLGEALSLRKLAAIAMAIAGVMLLTMPTSDASGANTGIGVLLLLLSSLSSGFYVIAAKKLNVSMPPATTAFGVCATGTIFTFPMAIAESRTIDFAAIMTVGNATTVLVYALFSWAIASWLFFAGVTRIPASATGMAFAVTPLTATFFSTVFLGESLSVYSCTALVMVVASIFLVESNGKRHAGVATAA
ncbi:DMT family transporter [Pseudomonas eucalypticola]|uniref:DMT family transporter n=1 Tax=Pseudomonas eucalypticola TaxID=2599595 RepID=A0A7D5D635_9PSED|nr:DMT family transporter [Pseudomonas eucalypticola]QKZ04239.1 DMT family transporter [Pseudomonas eucalypticola]